MASSQRLDLRNAQTLVMTPQLQQAIKLLQMSNQDLCAYVAAEIENNPFLESEGEGGGEGSSGESSDGEAKETGLLGLDGSEGGASAAGNYEDPYESGNQQGLSASSYDPSSPLRSVAETVADRPSLREHLLSQIHMDFVEPAQRMAAAAMVELLDEAGYLPLDLALVRAQFGLDEAAFEGLVTKLQTLDPPGIFARSLQECLTIQLAERDRLDPAMQALLAHLELLAKREMALLRKICQVDDEDLADMVAEIRSLTPRPALAFASDVSPVLTPDVFLTALPGGGWQVELNSETLPRVLANEHFYARLQGGPLGAEDKSYLSERWQQAGWLVKALRQRAETVLRVASEIVKKQDAFFLYGVQYLKPLILRDIAEALEMHESTVSRVTQNKYIATPRGLFELKYFFTNALRATGGGQDVSSLAVRERIKALVEEEKDDAILSDDRLMELLRAEGIDIARRTVAKYRESLDIPTSAQRRRNKRAGL